MHRDKSWWTTFFVGPQNAVQQSKLKCLLRYLHSRSLSTFITDVCFGIFTEQLPFKVHHLAFVVPLFYLLHNREFLREFFQAFFQCCWALPWINCTYLPISVSLPLLLFSQHPALSTTEYPPVNNPLLPTCSVSWREYPSQQSVCSVDHNTVLFVLQEKRTWSIRRYLLNAFY